MTRLEEEISVLDLFFDAIESIESACSVIITWVIKEEKKNLKSECVSSSRTVIICGGSNFHKIIGSMHACAFSIKSFYLMKSLDTKYIECIMMTTPLIPIGRVKRKMRSV